MYIEKKKNTALLTFEGQVQSGNNHHRGTQRERETDREGKSSNIRMDERAHL